MNILIIIDEIQKVAYVHSTKIETISEDQLRITFQLSSKSGEIGFQQFYISRALWEIPTSVVGVIETIIGGLEDEWKRD